MQNMKKTRGKQKGQNELNIQEWKFKEKLNLLKETKRKDSRNTKHNCGLRENKHLQQGLLKTNCFIQDIGVNRDIIL